MLFYSKRKELESLYNEWIEKENVKDCPFSVITFLAGYGLIDDEKACDFIEKSKEE